MIRPVRYSEILDAPNAQALLAEYAAECSQPEFGPINPQRDLYGAMETNGAMQAFGVYEDETLVGFATVLIYTLLHYGTRIANTESLFITKTHRTKGYGTELRSHLKHFARERGCRAFMWVAPVAGQFYFLLAAEKNTRQSNCVFLESL